MQSSTRLYSWWVLGAVVNKVHVDGISALHYACRRGDSRLVDVLLMANIKVNVICSLAYGSNERPINNSSALHVAAAYGSTAILKKLLAARAVLHLKNDLVMAFSLAFSLANHQRCHCKRRLGDDWLIG